MGSKGLLQVSLYPALLREVGVPSQPCLKAVPATASTPRCRCASACYSCHRVLVKLLRLYLQCQKAHYTETTELTLLLCIKTQEDTRYITLLLSSPTITLQATTTILATIQVQTICALSPPGLDIKIRIFKSRITTDIQYLYLFLGKTNNLAPVCTDLNVPLFKKKKYFFPYLAETLRINIRRVLQCSDVTMTKHS